ncbi:DUF2867 domain-containing protein [Vibrio sp. T187]|uniref:DUF2867 domain-containing protein n=1 Tax=Vibrio TaxID=662 RepID=UPI0010C9ADFA|nr:MULTISPECIES: DUF2867 domain-containing protein [Vibrio]MBW3698243.1 DUF2867 domain-containing protein [Vibrio sp. T187]
MVEQREFPIQTQVNGKESGDFYRDSFVVKTSKLDLSSVTVYHAIFGHMPKPVRIALQVRNAVMTRLGFTGASSNMSLPEEEIVEGGQAGFLTFELVSEQEVITMATENNMDMWLSVYKLPNQEFAVSTLVNLKTRSGKLYMAVIKPFHKIVAKYCIKSALKEGRI